MNQPLVANKLFPYTTLFRSCPCTTIFSTTKPSAGELTLKVRRASRFFSNSAICSSEMSKNFNFARAKLKRSEEHTSELQSRSDLICRLLLEKKNNKISLYTI